MVYILILVALAALPYLASLRNGFVYDDFDQIVVNPYLRNFHHLREIFTSSVWSFMGDFRGSSNYYRPLMSLGYLFCYQLFGLHALGFHLANLLTNIGVVLLVFLVTLKMFRSFAVALAAACIFALHPIHSEAVDWIAAVTELELALFYLLTFWFFLASARAAGKCSAPLQIAMAGSFVLALLSKEQALTLPFLAALYEHFFREDRAETTKVQKLRRYGALWLLATVYLVLRSRYLGGFAPSLDRPGFGTEDMVISALALIGRYCWKLIWPTELCAYYVFPTDVAALYPWALGGVVALAICVCSLCSPPEVQPASGFRSCLAARDAGAGIECSLDDQQPLRGALSLSRLGGVLLDGGLGRYSVVEFPFRSRHSKASRAAHRGWPDCHVLGRSRRHSKPRLAG